jgi:hypothetical protein
MIEEELPFTPRTAQRLMSITQSPALTNATHVSHFPASWGTLYAISRLPADLVHEPPTARSRRDWSAPTCGARFSRMEGPTRKKLDAVQRPRREHDALKASAAHAR